MTNRNEKINTHFTVVLMILTAAFSRMIPHPWNFTAVGAMALFGGAVIQSRILSLIVPVTALLMTDFILGFHSTMLFVYVPLVLTVMLGWNASNYKSPARVAGLSLLTSLLFFAVSNFGVWLVGGLYPVNSSGLISCFVAALPFFDNQIFGDLFFSGVLFGGYAFLKKIAPEFLGFSSKTI